MDSPIPFIAQTGVVFQRSVIDAQPLSREAGSDALTTRALWILRAPNPYYGSPGMCHEPTPYRPMMSDEYAKALRLMARRGVQRNAPAWRDKAVVYLGRELVVPPDMFAPTAMSDLLGTAVLDEVGERDRVLDNGVADRTTFLMSDVVNAVQGTFDLVIFDPPFRWFRPRDLPRPRGGLSPSSAEIDTSTEFETPRYLEERVGFGPACLEHACF